MCRSALGGGREGVTYKHCHCAGMVRVTFVMLGMCTNPYDPMQTVQAAGRLMGWGVRDKGARHVPLSEPLLQGGSASNASFKFLQPPIQCCKLLLLLPCSCSQM